MCEFEWDARQDREPIMRPQSVASQIGVAVEIVSVGNGVESARRSEHLTIRCATQLIQAEVVAGLCLAPRFRWVSGNLKPMQKHPTRLKSIQTSDRKRIRACSPPAKRGSFAIRTNGPETRKRRSFSPRFVDVTNA